MLLRCHLSSARSVFALVGFVALAAAASHLVAGEVRLKNGLVLEGTLISIEGLTLRSIRQARGPIKVTPMLVIENPLKRYIVSDRQVAELNRNVDLGRWETFTLKQKNIGGRSRVASVGRLRDVQPFDRHGRRTLILPTARGDLDVIQGVTEIGPRFVKVRSLTHHWEHGIATTSIPPDILDSMLRTASDQANPDDRMAIARFYLQAGQYSRALKELESIVPDFPELKQTAQDLGVELRQLQANQWIAELKRRRAAGQHELAYSYAKRFPHEGMGAAVRRDVSDFVDDYDQQRVRIDTARILLGEFEAQLQDPQALRAAPIRSLVSDNLDFESLERLDAFFNLADDGTLSPAEKLALAYSGFVLGASNAVTSLDEAFALWDARFLMLDFLRSNDPDDRNNLLSHLRKVEGISASRIVQMIPQLPFPTETVEVYPGVAKRIVVPAANGQSEAVYHALLPSEYDPKHSYPLVIGLRPAERSPEDVLRWWGGTQDKPGQSMRRGYIVIAPEYVEAGTSQYGYGASSHAVVKQALRDVRKRFNVDSDRVFLAGHGMGGDAVFDIAMAHPDLFAGAIPITGIGRNYCKYYWNNVRRLPFYIVGGQLDRNSLEQNAHTGQVNRMMRAGFNIVYVEYMGRGYESFYAEIHQLFDWMDQQRRLKYPPEIEMKVLRPTDDRFFWIQAADFPRNVLNADVLAGNRDTKVKPMQLTARVKASNTVRITRSGAKRHTIWLSPELVDFDRRLTVQHRGRRKFYDFLKPEIRTILEDLRVRGDRQKLYWAKLEID